MISVQFTIFNRYYPAGHVVTEEVRIFRHQTIAHSFRMLETEYGELNNVELTNPDRWNDHQRQVLTRLLVRQPAPDGRWLPVRVGTHQFHLRVR